MGGRSTLRGMPSGCDLATACVVFAMFAGCRIDVPNAAGYDGGDSTFGTSQGPGDGGTSSSGGVEPSTLGLDSTAAVSDSASGSSGSSGTTSDTESSTETGIEPAIGHAGSAFVNAGAVTTSPSYSMAWTFGQSSQVQNAMSSPSYRMRGGFIGAVADE